MQDVFNKLDIFSLNGILKEMSKGHFQEIFWLRWFKGQVQVSKFIIL